MEKTLPEISFQAHSDNTRAPRPRDALIDGVLCVNDKRVEMRVNRWGIALSNIPGIDNTRVEMNFPSEDCHFGGMNGGRVTCYPLRGGVSSYLITERRMLEYTEAFPMLRLVMDSRKRIWELGPGLSECCDVLAEKGADVTVFDSAPYDVFYAATQVAMTDAGIRAMVGNDRIDHESFSGWRDRCAKRLTSPSVRVVSGRVPDVFDTVADDPRPDVIIEMNGPGVSLFDSKTVRRELGDHRFSDFQTVLEYRPIGEYIRRLVDHLAPEGLLCFQLGSDSSNTIRVTSRKEDIERML